MNLNTATILRGPVIVNWRGASFFHKGALEVPMDQSVVDIEAEPFGIVGHRADTAKFPINLTPAGRTTEVENLINRYATSKNGDLINIEEYPVSLNADTDLLTTTGNHLLATGDEVMVHWLVTAPGGLSRTTRYYARVASDTTLTLHTSAAGAAANTGKVDITSAGSGVILDVTRALTLTTLSGLQIKYFNVGLIGVPDLEFSAVKQMLGQAQFMAFVRNGQDPEDADARYYALSMVSPPSTSFDPDTIKTQPPKVSWAFDAAWSGLQTRDGAKVAFDLKTSPVPNDAFGEDALGMIFNDLNLTASAALQGLTEAEIKAGLQAHTKLRGSNLSGGALEIETDYYTFEIADSILTKAPTQFASSEQRGGQFEFKSQKSFTGGAPDPTYELSVNE